MASPKYMAYGGRGYDTRKRFYNAGEGSEMSEIEKLRAINAELLEACKNLLYLGERMEEESGETDEAVEAMRRVIDRAEGVNMSEDRQ